MKNFRLQFGGKITSELKARYAKSNNWKDGEFQNLETTEMVTSPLQIGRIIYKQLTQAVVKEPAKPLPVLPFDKTSFLAPSEKTKFLWYGHSVVLMRMNGKTLLIDPMLGPNTTPIAPVANKRFSKNTLQLIDEFPEIDLILMTHDHYDHLDFDSIQKLKHKTKKYFVALGVKRHLVRWGVSSDLITEFDWWDNQLFEDINITFTPTRHFSGRVKKAMPVHWAGFYLSFQHSWFEPGDDFVRFAKEKKLDFILPTLGMQFDATTDSKEKWWESFL